MMKKNFTDFTILFAEFWRLLLVHKFSRKL